MGIWNKSSPGPPKLPEKAGETEAFRPPHLLTLNRALKSWLPGEQKGGAGVGWVLTAC